MAIALRGSPTAGDPGSTTNWVVTLPAGIVSGDVILVGISRDNNNLPTVTMPTGFVFLGQSGINDNLRVYIYRKVADGTEGASVTFTLSANEFGTWGCIAYSGVDNTTPEDVARTGLADPSTTATPVQGSQTTVTDHARVVGFFSNRGNVGLTGTPGSSATERIDHNDVGDNIILYVEDLDKTPAGAVALTFTCSSSVAQWNGDQVALRPATGSATHVGPFTATLPVVADLVAEWTGGGSGSLTLLGVGN